MLKKKIHQYPYQSEAEISKLIVYLIFYYMLPDFTWTFSEADLGLLQHSLTIITKRSLLDVAAVLDPPLVF